LSFVQIESAEKRHISIDQLPSLPSTVVDALRIANDTNASAADLERAISRDISLAGRVLKVANSAFVGFRRPIESVQEAVVLLGTRRVRAVASLQALAPMFSTQESSLICGRQLWAHGLGVALWTQQIGKRVGYPQLTHVYTAGLMHDMGIILMRGCVGEEYEDIVRESKEQGVRLDEMETERLGINHCRIGAMVCAKWMLSPRLTWLISRHHNEGLPDDAEGQILQLSDWCAQAMGLGEFPWSPPEPLPVATVRALGIHPAEMDEILLDGRFVREQIDGLLNR
jgi:HD-like signal output (HDOD) protein